MATLLTPKQRLFGIHATGYTEPHGKDRKTAEILRFWEAGVTSHPLRHFPLSGQQSFARRPDHPFGSLLRGASSTAAG
jgi:hypothetical protein